MSEEVLVNELIECYRNMVAIISDDKLKRLRTRARDAPTQIFTRGLPQTLILFAARSKLDVVQKALVKSSCKDLLSDIDSVSGEKFGYTAYLSILLYLAKKLGLDIGNSFEEILKKSVDNPILEKEFYIIAEWIKRFSEAYLPES